MDDQWKALVIPMLRDMMRIRVFEETVEQEALKGHVQGGIHLAIGQEAVAVGAHFALQPNDYVVGAHRGHHICLARGVDPRAMMAELMGKATGLSRGKSSSMHLIDPSHGVLGLDGIVGASIGIATGAGFSIRYRNNTTQVAVAFFGEGAANKGIFNESLNLAGLWNLPVIYICENNRYSVETPIDQSTAGGTIAERAKSYGFPGVTVDGMDVAAVWHAVAKARDRATSGAGPTLIQADTYRFRGHDIGDPQNYRPKEEVREWQTKDPIQGLITRAQAEGILTSDEIENVRATVTEDVDQAVQFALSSPEADIEAAHEFVYAKGAQ